jgi:5-methylcytosine-specific restriction endonuclease McrA
MGGRLCRHCGGFVAEGSAATRFAHDECRKTYEREKSRKRRARRGTTSQRGYGVQHQRLRKLAITQHPYCTDCGTTQDLTADHIVPLSKGGTNTLDNYAVRCSTCNTSKGAAVWALTF